MILAGCGATDENAKSLNESRFLRFGSGNRNYHLYVPASYSETEPAPLVLAYHGSNGTGVGLQQLSRLDRQAERYGFIVAYPTSAVGNWAEGCQCNNADRLGIDDLGLTRTLIDSLRSEFNIDTKKVYAVGFSQGGLFAQRLGCELSDRIAAIATVAATFSVPLAEVCQPTSPVGVWMMHGTEDEIIPWDGVQNSALSLLSADAAIHQWVEHNKCFQGFDSNSERLGSGLFLRTKIYDQCDGETQVQLYGLEGGIHVWPSNGIDPARILAEFFESQRK